MTRLEGKTALVTGAGSGIGKAIATLMVAEGARVIVGDVDRDNGQAVAESLGERAVFKSLDVRSESNWQSLFDWASSEFPGIDILVNNAGIALVGDIENTSLEDWERTQAVNSTGCFLGCRAGVRHMKTRGGSIVNISSITAMLGTAPYAAYTASKGAVRSLTKSVAAVCRDNAYPLRCNSVHPGAIRTPMTARIMASDDGTVGNAIAAGVGEPEDVAHMVVYLASDESRLVNGTEQVVDRTMCCA